MKRIALISDIHGNAVALEAVLDDLAGRGADEFVCLGDVAAGGPQPRQALARLRELGCPVVLGNADSWLLEGLPSEPEQEEGESDRLAAIVEWARAQLSSAEREFLRSFAPVVELELEGATLLCFHGSPRSANERILAETPQAKLEAILADQPASIYTGGHTHLQLLRQLGDALYLNPGSIGLPLAEDPFPSPPRFAEYALVEIEGGATSVELRRIAVDAEAAERAAAESGMPHPHEWAALLGRRIIRRNSEAIQARC